MKYKELMVPYKDNVVNAAPQINRKQKKHVQHKYVV